MSNEFAITHETDEQYEYEHRDGYTVKVRFDEFSNGSRVNTYTYDDTGDKVAYHRFRVNNADDRVLVHESGNTDAIPDAVMYALRSGGWVITNVHQTSLVPDDADPIEVQLLDARDGFHSLAQNCDDDVLTLYYHATARAIEIGMVTMILANSTDISSVSGKLTETVETDDRYEGLDAPNPHEFVDGLFRNAVDPTTQHSTEHHDHIVQIAETTRTIYNGGADYDDAWEQAEGLLGEPQ